MYENIFRLIMNPLAVMNLNLKNKQVKRRMNCIQVQVHNAIGSWETWAANLLKQK